MKSRASIFSLLDQVTNSIWTFISLRLVYSSSSNKEIVLFGLTYLFSYSCSGLLRSKYVNPLYASIDGKDLELKFNIVPLLRLKLFFYFLCSGFLFMLFISTNQGYINRQTFELLTLMLTIVLLDFFRSFLQLNGDFLFSVLINCLGLTILLVLWKIEESRKVFDLNVLDAYVISNITAIISLAIFFSRIHLANVAILSPLINKSLGYSKLAYLSVFEFALSRIVNLAGQAILLKINQEVAASLTIGLFIYSTFPFSVLNGLSPVYLKFRNFDGQGISARSYFALISAAIFSVPLVSVFWPAGVNIFFGSNKELPKSIVLFVILMVAQKTYDSARSLDCMLNFPTKKYLILKSLIYSLVYLCFPLALVFREPFVASALLFALIISQVYIMERGRL